MAKKKHGGHHGGAWKVAYADFVTAMMALFIVLWLLASMKESTKAAVAAYFKDPTIFKSGGRGFLNEEGIMKLEQRLQEIQEQSESPEQPESTGQTPADEKGLLLDSAQQLQEMIQQSPALREFEGQVNIELTEEGLRIQIQDQGIKSLFDVGSTEPKAGSRKLLEAIGQVLVPLPNSIIVEGHTDSRAFQGRSDYSNWELSGDRANAARRILESTGIEGNRIARVVGWADRRPMEPEDPTSDRNRRISIIVRYQDAPSP